MGFSLLGYYLGSTPSKNCLVRDWRSRLGMCECWLSIVVGRTPLHKIMFLCTTMALITYPHYDCNSWPWALSHLTCLSVCIRVCTYCSSPQETDSGCRRVFKPPSLPLISETQRYGLDLQHTQRNTNRRTRDCCNCSSFHSVFTHSDMFENIRERMDRQGFWTR